MGDTFREDTHSKEGIIKLHYLRTIREGVVGMFTILASMIGVTAGEWEDPRLILVTIGGITVGAAIRTALGIYMTTKAENKYLLHEIEQERLEIKLVPELEKEELKLMYKAKGFEGELLNTVVDRIIQDEDQWIREMVQEEIGYSNILDNIGLKVTAYLFFLFIFGSFFPLMPYLLLYKQEVSPNYIFTLSVFGTLIGLFFVGILWKNITGGHWFKSAIKSIIIGFIAFGASLVVGMIFPIDK